MDALTGSGIQTGPDVGSDVDPYVGSVHPVILCGGVATRLWPVSRAAYPKQFSALAGEGTLLQDTLARLEGAGFRPPMLLTTEALRFIAAGQAQAAGVAPGPVLIEPELRSTGPAIAAAAALLAEDDPQAVMLVLPSDHRIADPDAFHAALGTAIDAARGGALVTFGIVPDRPETGYGYIELAEGFGPGAQTFRRFVEKPDLATAEAMLRTGRYLWNSGMFVFTAAAVLAAFEAHAPEVAAAARAAVSAARRDADFVRLDADAYGASPAVSIDVAVMERVQGQVIPVNCGWSDLGSWRAVHQVAPRDGDGVAADARSIAIACTDTLLRSDDPGIAMVGVGLRNIAAVATRDAVLVTDLDHAQDVRGVVAALQARGWAQAETFARCHRPWGWYESLVRDDGFQVKQIVVAPGGRLSLQSHVHRAEHWVVVAGEARVTVGDTVSVLGPDCWVQIPQGAVHRLENPGKVEMRLIEVQLGSYLGEDDIVRYEDIYDRT